MDNTTPKSYIYAIQSDYTEFIKIGFTASCIRGRMKTLQTGSPFRLQCISFWSGTLQDERDAHALFDAYREVGEWFRPHSSVIDYVISKNAASPAEIAAINKQELGNGQFSQPVRMTRVAADLYRYIVKTSMTAKNEEVLFNLYQSIQSVQYLTVPNGVSALSELETLGLIAIVKRVEEHGMYYLRVRRALEIAEEVTVIIKWPSSYDLI